METEKIKLAINFNYYENLRDPLEFTFQDLVKENAYEKFEEIESEVLEHLLDKSIDALYVSAPKMRIYRPYFIVRCNVDKIYILESSLSFYDREEYENFMKTLEENGWILKYSKKHDDNKRD